MRLTATVLLLAVIGCSGPPNTIIDAGGGGGGGGGDGSDGGCTELWTCSPWRVVDTDAGTPGGGTATRTCFDAYACGSTTSKPAETTPLPALDFNYYKCRVQPIQAHSCGMIGCHGAVNGRDLRVFSRGRLRNDELVAIPAMCLQPPKTVNIGQVGYANVECAANIKLTNREWVLNYDSSRAFMIGLSAAQADQSELLTQPTEGSAAAHVDSKWFKAGDPDHTTIKNWLTGASLPACDAGVN